MTFHVVFCIEHSLQYRNRFQFEFGCPLLLQDSTRNLIDPYGTFIAPRRSPPDPYQAPTRRYQTPSDPMLPDPPNDPTGDSLGADLSTVGGIVGEIVWRIETLGISCGDRCHTSRGLIPRWSSPGFTEVPQGIPLGAPLQKAAQLQFREIWGSPRVDGEGVQRKAVVAASAGIPWATPCGGPGVPCGISGPMADPIREKTIQKHRTTIKNRKNIS